MTKRLNTLILLFIFALNSNAVAQDASQTGDFEIEATPNSILGEELAAEYSKILDQNEEIHWQVYVPSTYNPENPSGVMVYSSPNNRVDVPVGWMSIMEEQNLIWISAYMAGESFVTQKRVLKSVLAVPLIEQRYTINTERIYISGFSDGGRIASIVSMDFPHMFKGAIYNGLSIFWENHTPPQIDLIKKNRFVFITGKLDPYILETREVHRQYKKAGVQDAKLMVIPRLKHRNPNRRRFKEAIEYLDQE